jgi:hypothetical protein
MLPETDERIDAAQPREGRPVFVAGALLAELLSDPMTQTLMAADRVERPDLEALLQRARLQLGLSRPSSPF